MTITDRDVLNRMRNMCQESLCPDNYEKWESVEAALLKNRTNSLDCNRNLPSGWEKLSPLDG